jgi:hypothetical protein
MEMPGREIETEGYSTEDSYNWFCLSCVSKYGTNAAWILSG